MVEDNNIRGRRALLTETERKAIAGEMESSAKYQSVSRVRKRVRTELPTDLIILKENHSELFDEVMEVVNDA